MEYKDLRGFLSKVEYRNVGTGMWECGDVVKLIKYGKMGALVQKQVENIALEPASSFSFP